ncbi:MAG TPA: surface carbohydrate biosynthesis protein [Myxococcota bacterium]
MASPQATLILPVESQVRELDAKLLLGCAAAERGFRVILGSRAFIHYAVASFPRGVYLAKSMRSLSELMFGILNRLGHEIVAWDEEALVRFPRDDYYRRRLSPKALRRVSRLFAWGEDDAQLFRDYPDYPGTPIDVTGNPRIDLIRPDARHYFDDEVAEIRERYGDFVILNTNFGYVNAFASRLNLVRPSKNGGAGFELGENARGMHPDFARGLALHKQALFERFRALIPQLADALPHHNLVVRPHPAEDHAVWREAGGGRRNVHVVNEKSVIPWLIAASALVHNGCTTAVEATALGMPAIAYRPVTAEAFDAELPNSLSHEAFTPDELLAKLRGILSGALGVRDDAGQRALLERQIAALEGRLASDRIVDALCAAGYRDRHFPQPSLPKVLGARMLVRGRTLSKRLKGMRSGSRNTKQFHDHRFPGTSVRDLGQRIERLSKQLGRFGGLRLTQRSDHIYCIES